MKNRKNNRNALMLLVVVLAVILLVLLILLVMMNENNSNDITKTDAETTIGENQPPVAPDSNATEQTSGDAVIENTTVGNNANGETLGNETEPGVDPTETTGSDEKVPESSTKDVEIQTPYCTLYYSNDWRDFLEVDKSEGQPYTVTFNAKVNDKTQKLFAVGFGGGAGNSAGIVKTASGDNVEVYVEVCDIKLDSTWTDNEKIIVYSMQEALNALLAKMPLEDNDVSVQPGGEILPPDNGEDMIIETACCELHYPARWAEYLELEHDKSSVAIYAVVSGKRAHLFTVRFGGNQGIPVTTIKDFAGNEVQVLVSISELTLDNTWTEENKKIAQAMQEDMNYLLDKLN